MKGIVGFLVFLILVVIVIFVLAALASGGTVGDGVMSFIRTSIEGMVSVWNLGGSN